MNFEFSRNSLENVSADGVVVFAFETNDKPVLTKNSLDLDKILNGIILQEIEGENFKAKLGDLFSINSYRKILSTKIFVLGLGKKEEFNPNELRNAFANLARRTKGKISSIALPLLDSREIKFDIKVQSQVVAEGLLLGNYRFIKYKKKEKKEKDLEVTIFLGFNRDVQDKIKEGIEKAEFFCKATKLARDLVNEPSAVVNPTFLADLAMDIARKNKNISCTVYNKKQIEKMGMGAFLGIAQAADTEPKFIHLEYIPQGFKKKDKIALVGKGITFDTGGISLKGDESMLNMKMDMAGAAAVLGAFSVISEVKPKMAVMGLIAATPNMVSGKSTVPGDVVRALNGKTIEILNTDAEGRVTLADSLVYAVKKGATQIIDLATLTGAAEVALGPDISALLTNNKEFGKRVEEAAFKAGEKVWKLPLEETYRKMNKSEVADIANIPSTRYGGAITGALFLEEFVNGKPWVHLDIAGPAFAKKEFNLGPKGGTGFGTRTLLNFLLA